MRCHANSARRLSIIPALLALIVPAAGAGRAKTRETTPTVTLVVQKLRDAGGLAPAAKGQAPLNEMLTAGTIRYLDQHKQQFEVWDARSHKPIPHPPGEKLLSLEGDLSRVAGDTPEKDTYLLIMRLYEEGNSHRIIAQWSGSARSLIYLTNNLHRDPRFSMDGLLGEIGDRVTETVNAFVTPNRQQQEQAFAQMLAQIKHGQGLKASLLPDAAPPAEKQEGKPALVAGAAFRVEVTSANAGSVYVVAMAANGHVRPLLIPEQSKEVMIMPNKPLLLPEGDRWQAPLTSKAQTEEIVVLVHSDATLKAHHTTLAHRQSTASPPLSAQGGMGLQDEPDVQVINGGNRLLPHISPDPDTTRLMALLQSDAPGTWRIACIKVRIQPTTK